MTNQPTPADLPRRLRATILQLEGKAGTVSVSSDENGGAIVELAWSGARMFAHFPRNAADAGWGFAADDEGTPVLFDGPLELTHNRA
ncbi:hypothetical protein [Engelhardtia mirabilis]|uniref:Uncharacterized protein n=1 Tax=Engelhardtia mirabilis TaxID=2528011 RepID=A0A518BL47_9BACT|nr:hypothetical protein Pla133_27750 [Planctomycetes bacterium Pla133]QDV02013.1 hypothetical protein Pla86_27740 [Planctomycetes bacterium Pla86]